MASPDERSICRYCDLTISRMNAPVDPWVDPWGSGECGGAPNPEEGPMPGHQPNVIARNPNKPAS
jgi:hypothetical protein